MNYLNIKGIPKKFDCCHLAAQYLSKELNIDTSDWNAVSRDYDIRKEAEYIHDELLNLEMIDVEDSYQKGDIIIYKVGKYRAASATCVNNKVALVVWGVSKLTHIERIENKLYHLRHKSMIEEVK